MVSATERHPVSWRSWIAPAFSVALLIGVFFVVHRELAHFQLRDVLAYLRQIPVRDLVAAAFGTIGSYLLLGLFDLSGLRYIGNSLPYARVAPKSFITYAVVNNAGATVLTGAAMRLRLYAPHGLTAIEVATLQVFCSLTTVLGVGTLVALSLLLAGDQAATALHLPRSWTWFFGWALLAAIVAYIGWGSLARRGIQFRGWALRPPGPLLTPLQVVLGTIELTAACFVLWLLLPSSARIELPAFVGAFALALLAGILSNLPGGLGVFESVVLLAVPNAPPDQLLGALLAYRAIYYVAPLIAAATLFAALEMYAYRGRLERMRSALRRRVWRHIGPR